MAHARPGRATTALRSSIQIVLKRPRLESKPIGRLLRGVMYVGLLGLAVALASGLILGVAWIVELLEQRQTIALSEHARETTVEMIAFFGMVTRTSLLVATLYGFASFLWYKLEAGRVVGRWGTLVLFLIVPASLLVIKNVPGVNAAIAEQAPWSLVVARFYSFAWYVIVFFMAMVTWKPDGEGTAPVLPRWAILAVLCYVPYGVVLFQGEQAFFSNWVMDGQLIAWALFPMSLVSR